MNHFIFIRGDTMCLSEAWPTGADMKSLSDGKLSIIGFEDGVAYQIHKGGVRSKVRECRVMFDQNIPCAEDASRARQIH